MRDGLDVDRALITQSRRMKLPSESHHSRESSRRAENARANWQRARQRREIQDNEQSIASGVASLASGAKTQATSFFQAMKPQVDSLRIQVTGMTNTVGSQLTSLRQSLVQTLAEEAGSSDDSSDVAYGRIRNTDEHIEEEADSEPTCPEFVDERGSQDVFYDAADHTVNLSGHLPSRVHDDEELPPSYEDVMREELGATRMTTEL